MENQNEVAISQPIGQASQELINRAKEESYNFLNPAVWESMAKVAKVFHESGAMPKSIDTVPKLMVILQAGKESGLQPLEAMSSFYLVNGKVAMYGDTAISQVIRAGHDVEWGECTHETATVTITRGDTGKKMSATFTMKMVTDRGLTSNPLYRKFPDNMLKFKAFGMVAKFLVPDALRGISIKEDIEGEVIEDAPEEPKKVAYETKEEKVRPSLDEAIATPEPEPQPEPAPEKPKRKPAAKKPEPLVVEEVAEEPAQEEQPEPATEPVEESAGAKAMREARETKINNDKRFDQLVEKEMNDPMSLTADDRKFLASYKRT